jgi:hypothetical protein
MRHRKVVWGVVCAVGVTGTLCAIAAPGVLGFAWESVVEKARGGYSIQDRLAQFGARARARMAPHFRAARVAYPPTDTAWVAVKDECVVHVYARSLEEPWRMIRSYPVLAAGGKAGPKLREGDRHVPEGVYRIVVLDPNSLHHVSLRLGYPNAFDRAIAEADGRTDLGGDVMIHGRAPSAGCLAMGDEAAEDLFTLAADAACKHVTVIVCPTDFREHAAGDAPPGAPSWTERLYADIAHALRPFPR